jgi:TetR/AcrR family transcriptional regulator, regulator of autoinduction and epiphytic fitness
MEKRRLILEGAMQEFLDQGYSGASMDRISARAGVSKATVYSHFQEKEQLYVALIESMASDPKLAFSLDSAPKPGTVSTSEHIKAVTDLLVKPIDACGPDDELIRFMRIIIAESGRFPKLAQTFVEKVEKPAVDAVAEYLKDCGIPADDAEPVAWMISATLVYHVLISTIMNGAAIMPMNRARLIETLCKLVQNKWANTKLD